MLETRNYAYRVICDRFWLGVGFITLLVQLTGCVSPRGTGESSAPSSDLQVIDAIIKSLNDRPGQFVVNVTVTGMSVTHSGFGGTGMSVTAIGGGGGATTGMVVTTSGADVEIAEAKADAVIAEQARRAVEILVAIREELATPEPKKETLLSKLADLAKTYVAPAIKAAIEAIIHSRFPGLLP